MVVVSFSVPLVSVALDTYHLVSNTGHVPLGRVGVVPLVSVTLDTSHLVGNIEHVPLGR